jgi:hypothetical protein
MREEIAMKVKPRYERLVIVSAIILLILACNIPSGQLSVPPTTQAPPVITTTKSSLTETVPSSKTPTPTPPDIGPIVNFGGGGTEKPTYSPTFTPTPTPTPTPTLPNFDPLINFGGGGGGGLAAGLSYCGMYEQSYTVVAPAIYGTAMTIMDKASERSGIICLRGVRPDVPFTIHIVSPDGNINLSGQFTITDDKIIWGNGPSYEITYWGSREKDGLIYGELYIWWPVGLPFGQWNIYAEGNGLQASGPFDNMMQVIAYVNRTREIGIVESEAQSKIIPIYKGGLHRVKVNPNGGLDINGAGFASNEATYILLYKMNGWSGMEIQWSLAYSTSVKADSNGRLFVNLPGPFATGQEYLVVSITDINRLLDDYGRFNFTDDSIGHDIFDIQSSSVIDNSSASGISSCPGAPSQRIVVNQRGYVCTKQDAVKLRNTPKRSGSEIMQLAPGASFTVIGGPSCADSWSWWNVRLDNGTSGWISEGGDEIDPYFICPLK